MYRIAVFLALVSLATFVFYNAERTYFGSFQKDSEALVIGKIVADRSGIVPERNANLGFVSDGPFVYDKPHFLASYDLLNRPAADPQFVSYFSQYGIQGQIYSILYNSAGLASIDKMAFVCAALTALVLTALAFLYHRALTPAFGTIFYLTSVGSPWVVAFSKNLYWSPFLWFLPTLLTVLGYLARNPRVRIGYFALFFVAMILKSLSGYEYLSTILWLACSIFLIDPFLPNPRFSSKQALILAAILFACGVLAFALAVLLHAGTQGDTIADGLHRIWESGVKRRTYADPATADPALRESLAASPWAVLATYLVDWSGPLLFMIGGRVFPVLMVTALMVILFKFRSGHSTRWRDAAMYLIFAAGPVSWYVLAKGHSHVHTFLNFVLWYFGFVAAVGFINFEGLLLLLPQGWKRFRITA